jgi:putative FmdB family regulatory protein|tara:strand:- start:311 stop:583 length:273 start_codon:yes stop_codon:yes gene_type:complete
MPLYQYKCKKCGELEDSYSNMMMVSSEDPLVGSKCSSCKGGKLHRVVTAPNAIVREGGAWATAIRKDQIGFSEMDMGDSIGRMNSNKQRS